MASGRSIPDTVSFHTDATIYRSILDAEKIVKHSTSRERYLFIYVSSGSLQINGHLLQQKDQARISSVTSLELKASKNADFILIDVPE